MSDMAFDLDGVSVMIGIPCGPDLPWQTTQSLIETVMLLKDKNIPFEVRLVAGCSIVEQARTVVVTGFLESDMNRLMMIDSDMAWKADDVVRLLCLSTKMQVVGATYPAKRDATTFMLGEQDFSEMQMNEWGCFSIHGMGLGFTMVRRTVIEQLAERAPKLKFPTSDQPQPHIFRCGERDGVFEGEDMAFFRDVLALDIEINLDPTIQLGHVGVKKYTGNFMDAIRRA